RTLTLVGGGAIMGSTNIMLAAGASIIVTNRTDSTLSLAAGQLLQGVGTVQGNLAVGPGATVAPGLVVSNVVGTVTVSSNVTLSGTTFMKLDKLNGVNDILAAGGTASLMTFGGTLALTNLNVALAANDIFSIFSAANYSGSFSSITPATP